MMSPEEKATWLIREFKIDSESHTRAKKCAIICVEEIIKSVDDFDNELYSHEGVRMPKTKQIQASCKSISSESETRDSMMVTMGEPDIDHVLEDIYKEDLAAFVQDKFSPDDLFTEKQLDAWVEENGYTKE